jgi:hypothetical protein
LGVGRIARLISQWLWKIDNHRVMDSQDLRVENP